MKDPFDKIAPFYDHLMSAVPYGQWVDYIELLVRRCGITPRKVVDLATGTGTVALMLARRGYEVVGVDRSKAMLREAKRKTRAGPYYVEFLCQDLTRLSLPQEFQLAVCLYDSLNYLPDADHLLRAFKGVARCLLPGGAFVFDINSIFALQANLFTQQNQNPDAPVRYRWVSQYDPEERLATVEMEFHISATGETLHATHRQKGYTVAEVSAALEAAGFQVNGTYDAFSLLPPGQFSDRIYFVALKPAE